MREGDGCVGGAEGRTSSSAVFQTVGSNALTDRSLGAQASDVANDADERVTV